MRAALVAVRGTRVGTKCAAVGLSVLRSVGHPNSTSAAAVVSATKRRAGLARHQATRALDLAKLISAALGHFCAIECLDSFPQTFSKSN